ncbi:type II secretion system protein E [Thermincola ferriacetica]|uniref:Type II secretion system protein E n=1 Tax=Thermincola ferriacetica TaxID=281456 RepID=A0A0L6W498_9FIRM|nr:ATPase, T2SS/T4P/T4SS family [Thermincola ferriacetica]KNZ70360.1 type II secretion system protein E [Thermincola ferriacetica]
MGVLNMIQHNRQLTPAEKEDMVREIRRELNNLRLHGQDPKEKLHTLAKTYLEQNAPDCLGNINAIVQELHDRLFSLGALEKYLRDDEVTDIHVFGTRIMVEKNGCLYEDSEGFLNEEEVRLVTERIASQAGKEISEAVPSIDAELYDGSRAIVIIPPEAEKPYITIRRHTMMHRVKAGLEELAETLGGLDTEYFRRIVKERKNILVCGQTGAGKTTLINALAKEIPRMHKVAVLEDTRELELDLPYVMYLKTREGTEDVKPITYSTILQDCLRSRPARIILTEVRHPRAAYELIQCLNSGHLGSMTTIHANSAMDGLYRLETLIQEHSNLTTKIIRQLIVRVIDVVVSIVLKEDEDGNVCGREIREVVEVEKTLDSGRYMVRLVGGTDKKQGGEAGC